jgi:hypothetical protein
MVSFYNMCQLLEVARQQHRAAVVHQRKLEHKRILENRHRLAMRLAETRTPEQEKLARARTIARAKVLGRGNRPPDKDRQPEDYARYLQAVEEEIPVVLKMMDAGHDPLAHVGGGRGASRTLGSLSTAGRDEDVGVSDRDKELRAAERAPRDDSVALPKGQADAKQIYHAVTHNPQDFTGRNWSYHDLLLKIVELGILPAEEPDRFEKAMEWLTQGKQPLFHVKGDKISVNPAKLGDVRMGADAYARASNAREGDYIPGMAHPGERYTRNRDRARARVALPGEMPPMIRQQVDKVRAGIDELHDMLDMARAHQFADITTFSDKLEAVMSQFRTVAQEKLLPGNVRQELTSELTDIRTAMMTELKPLFDKANPLRDAKDAMRAVRMVMMSQDQDIGKIDDALRAATAAMEELQTHPTASKHAGTAQEIEKMNQELQEFKASWKRTMNPQPTTAPTPAPAPEPVPATPTATTKPPAKKRSGGFAGRVVKPPVKPSTDDLF